MLWQGVHLETSFVASAKYGGPIAVVRDDRKLSKVGVSQTSKPVVRIFTSAGRLLSSFNWDEADRLFAFGWTDDEVLLCVDERGQVLPYSVFGELQQNQFSLGSEVAAVGIKECHIWGSGLVVLTNSNLLYAVTNLREPRVQCLSDPLIEHDNPPLCMTVIEPQFTMSGLLEVLLAVDGAILVVDADNVTTRSLVQGTIVRMAVAPSGQLLACFTRDGRLLVMSTSFSKILPEFGTKSSLPPEQLVWCGVDSVVLYWEEIALMVGPYGDWVKYTYDEPATLVPECDGVRILTRSRAEFLQRVPDSLVSIFGIGSFTPGALLYDALELFDAQSARANENLRLIGDKLGEAVEECIEAAGHEFDISLQRSLLRAASYGRTFLQGYPPNQVADMCKTLRVLNAVRAVEVGIPLSYAEYEEFTPRALVARLLSTHKHLLALRVSDLMGLPADRVLLHWATAKMQASSKLGDKEVLDLLLDKLSQCAGISWAQIAATAHRRGRPRLAAMLLDHEPCAAEQVPLLTSMGEDERALVKAIESGDTDLAYLAVFHLWRKCSFGEFVKLIDEHPQARDLFLAYCRRTDPELLKSYLFSVGATVRAADAIAKEAWKFNEKRFLEGGIVGPTEVNYQARLLDQAKDLYAKSKEHTLHREACECSSRLLKFQAEIEVNTKQRIYSGLSLHDTIRTCLVNNHQIFANKLKTDFKVSDKHFWWLKMGSLVRKHDWIGLENFAKEKKSPIGYEPFVRACIDGGAPVRETAKYIARLTDLTARAQFYSEVGMIHEAAEAQQQAQTSDTSYNKIQNLLSSWRAS